MPWQMNGRFLLFMTAISRVKSIAFFVNVTVHKKKNKKHDGCQTNSKIVWGMFSGLAPWLSLIIKLNHLPTKLKMGTWNTWILSNIPQLKTGILISWMQPYQTCHFFHIFSFQITSLIDWSRSLSAGFCVRVMEANFISNTLLSQENTSRGHIVATYQIKLMSMTNLLRFLGICVSHLTAVDIQQHLPPYGLKNLLRFLCTELLKFVKRMLFTIEEKLMSHNSSWFPATSFPHVQLHQETLEKLNWHDLTCVHYLNAL